MPSKCEDIQRERSLRTRTTVELIITIMRVKCVGFYSLCSTLYLHIRVRKYYFIHTVLKTGKINGVSRTPVAF